MFDEYTAKQELQKLRADLVELKVWVYGHMTIAMVSAGFIAGFVVRSLF